MKKPTRIYSLLALLMLIGTLIPGRASAEKLVAAIVTGDLPRYQQAHESLQAILLTGGYDASKLKIFVQTPNPDTMSLTNSIRRSVAAGAEMLITYGASATLIATKEAKDIPVLFADVYDPVALGIVQNMAAPGVNRSGASCKIAVEPLLEMVQKILPGTRIGILANDSEPGSKHQADDIEKACQTLKLTAIRQNIKSSKKLDEALQTLGDSSDILFLTESVLVNTQAPRIMEFAGKQNLAVISMIPGLANQGALLNLEADPKEQGTLAGVHALQVLAGQKAFMLPVREAKKVSLIVNLKTAGALNLQIPEAATKTAAKVIR